MSRTKGTLFRVEHNKNIFDLNPEAKSISEFAYLTDKMFKCLVFFADYKSPFRQKPKDERFTMAALQAGYKVDSHHQTQLEKRARLIFGEQNEYWNAAYRKYMDLQHDEDREMLQLVDTHLDNLRQLIGSPSTDEAELEKRTKMVIQLPAIMKTKRDLAKIAGKEEELMGDIQDEFVETQNDKIPLIDRVNAEFNDTGDQGD
jgi:hypothetical protein